MIRDEIKNILIGVLNQNYTIEEGTNKIIDIKKEVNQNVKTVDI